MGKGMGFITDGTYDQSRVCVRRSIRVHSSENVHTPGKLNTRTLRRSNILMCFRL